MYQYLRARDGISNRLDVIKRVSDGATIPNDPTNRDWVEYQAWLNLGYWPLPA